MIKAGKEEESLAIEIGDVDQRGRPKIAVIADGAWSKRSYKTNYNALSGVVRNIVISTFKYYLYYTIFMFEIK